MKDHSSDYLSCTYQVDRGYLLAAKAVPNAAAGRRLATQLVEQLADPKFGAGEVASGIRERDLAASLLEFLMDYEPSIDLGLSEEKRDSLVNAVRDRALSRLRSP